MSQWVFYDCPWWGPYLWAFAVYAVARFAIHYIWRRIR